VLHSFRQAKIIWILLIFYCLQTKVELDTAFQYDVKWELPWARPIQNRDKPLLFRAFDAAKEVIAKDFLPKTPPERVHYGIIFDGMSNAYAVRQLPFPNNCQVLTVEVNEDVDGTGRPLSIKVKMQLVKKVDMKSAIQRFCREGRTTTRPVGETNIFTMARRT
jgi:hypothetical protein